MSTLPCDLAQRHFSMRIARLLGTLIFVAIWSGPEPAFACRGPSLERNVFFEQAPFHLKVPVIAEVTITQLLASTAQSAFAGERGDNHSFVGLARVEKIIAGSITNSIVKVSVATPTSCDHAFQIGDRGIIAGTIKSGTGGVPEFFAISEAMHKQRMQKSPGVKN